MMEVKGSNWIYISILICGLFISYVSTQQALKSSCYHQKKKVAGVCEYLDKCDSAAEDFFVNDIDPQLCSFTGPGGKIQIVCCPGKEPVTQPEIKQPIKNEKKSLFYCREYASKVFEFKLAVSGGVPTNISTCGRTSVPLIFGGELAKSQEFPHMALVGYGEASNIQWNCGGTLISDQWVMTAAHCCYTQYGDAKFVRLGELNYRVINDETETQDFSVIEIKKHPKHGFKQYDDIGLLKLNKQITFTPYVRPACLYPDYKLNVSSAIATGWGDVGFFGDKSADLLKVTLRFASFEECNKTFEINHQLDKGIIDETQVCAGAGPNDGLKDTCAGDSGGPLQIDAEPEFYCMYYIVGVTSFGKPCAIAKRPSVYVRVSAYLPWIESIIWPN